MKTLFLFNVKRLLRVGAIVFLFLFFSGIPLSAEIHSSADWEAVHRHTGYNTEVERAVDKGLSYLASLQKPNGSFGKGYEVALTSLAGLAFLASGSTPRGGPYAKSIRKAVQFLIHSANMRGYISDATNKSRMHGQGLALSFLSQVYGEGGAGSGIDQKKLNDVIKNGVNLIEFAQHEAGGWGYDPSSDGMDENSVTVTIVEALRTARDAGFKVSAKAHEKGLAYIKRCANADGSFAYNLTQQGSNGSLGLTGAGVSSLLLFGDYRAPEVKKGIHYILQLKDKGEAQNFRFLPFTYYSYFYLSYAMLFSGETPWNDWYKYVKGILLPMQNTQGAWQSLGQESLYGTEYATAFSLLILQMPKRYLPMFQN